MQLLRRRSDHAYYSNVLALPRSYVSEQQLAGALTYDLGKKKGLYQAYAEDAGHYLVPRNYIQPAAFRALPFPVVDARLRRFPRVRFKSDIVLDGRDLSQNFQREGVAAMLAADNGILSLRCGAGKTICCIHAIHLLQTPALVLVTDKGLAEQWTEEILEHTDLGPDDIGFIGDGTFSWIGKKITIGLVQTVAGRAVKETLPPEMLWWFGVVVCDEAHTTAGPAYFGQAVSPFPGRRWGLSATPSRNDGFNSLLRYTIGPVVYSYLEPELTPAIYFRRLDTQLNTHDVSVKRAISDVTGEVHLQKVYSYLATRDDRVSIIAKEIRAAVKKQREILVLSQSRAMLERLEQLFPDAGIVHGGIDDRKERLRRIRECNPVIATSSLGRQALNKPKLDLVLVLEPFSDAGVLQQLLGRVQRKYEGKPTPVAVFYDDIHIERMHRITMKMRRLFARWPDNQGGRLRWQNTGP